MSRGRYVNPTVNVWSKKGHKSIFWWLLGVNMRDFKGFFGLFGTFALGGGSLGLVEASTPSGLAQLNQQLEFQLQVAQKAFESFFAALEKAPKKTLPYAAVVGSASDPSDRYPPTQYSRFQHFYRSLRAVKWYKATNLTPAMKQGIVHALGSVHAPKRNLISAIQALTARVSLETKNRETLKFLLGMVPTPPQGCPMEASLKTCLDEVLKPLTDAWSECFTYSEDETDSLHLYALAHQIARLQNTEDATVQARLKEVVGAVGTPEVEDSSTLFGQVIRSQRFLETVLRKSIPVPLERLHHLFTSPTCSLAKSLQGTLEYIRGESDVKPKHSFKNRYQALYKLYRRVVLGKLLAAQCRWPKDDEPESLQTRMQQQAARLSNLRMIDQSPELEQLQTLWGVLANHSYAPGSLMDLIVTFANTLAVPPIPFEEEEFEEAVSFVGNAGQASSTTLWGIVETISKRLQKPQNGVWKDLLALVGSPQDLAQSIRQNATFYGLLNALFENELTKAPFPWGRFQALASQIAQREDLPPHLRTMLNSGLQTSFEPRVGSVEAELRRLIRTHQFAWADQVVEAIYLHSSALERTLEGLLVQPASTLMDTLGQAWWREDGVLKDLNALLIALRSGGLIKLLKHQRLFIKTTTISLRNTRWYWKEYSEFLRKPQWQTSPLVAAIGLDPVKAEAPELRLKSLRDRMQYLRDFIPFSAISESENDPGRPFSQILYDDLVQMKTGLFEQFRWLYQQLIQGAKKGVSETVMRQLDEELGSLGSLLSELLFIGGKTCFRWSVSPERAQMFGWFGLSTGADCLRTAFRGLYQFFRQVDDITVLEAIRKLGEDFHTQNQTSLFGRLSACEHLLLEAWEKGNRIPWSALAPLVADLWERTHSMLNAGWSNTTLQQLGQESDLETTLTLFGLMKRLQALCAQVNQD